MKSTKSLAERIADADARGGDLLAQANEAAEAGKSSKAERLYQRGQYWVDMSNRLRGNGDGR